MSKTAQKTVKPPTMLETAHRAVELAQKAGAAGAMATASKWREIELEWRDGKVERTKEATTRELSIELYVDGRFSAVTTSDWREPALAAFVQRSVAMTRALAADKFRGLADPTQFAGRATVDLLLEDPAYERYSPADRKQRVQALEAAARSVPGADKLLSVGTTASDAFGDVGQASSNGFEGAKRMTRFDISASVSVKDADGRRPEDYAHAAMRTLGDLPSVESVGKEATQRALARLGASKAPSALATMVLDQRVAGQFVNYLGQALNGAALQQKRSFFEGKLGKVVASPKLTIHDDPLLVKGLGSRLYDKDGVAAKPFPIFEGGVLKAYYIDTYYGRKLSMAPTTGGYSNLRWSLGDRNAAQLVADVKDGFYVTSFLGGNSNATTGDFSLGVVGARIVGGKLAGPIGEMNISGNHLDVWKRLAVVGNDPYLYSAGRAPTLVFEAVQFAGT